MSEENSDFQLLLNLDQPKNKNERLVDAVHVLGQYVDTGTQKTCLKLKAKLQQLISRIDARFAQQQLPAKEPPRKFSEILKPQIQLPQSELQQHKEVVSQARLNFEVEPRSGLPVKDQVVKQDKLSALLNGVQIVKLDNIMTQQKSLNWVTFGVVVNNETTVKVTNNGSTYQQMYLSRLDHVNAPQCILFLHDQAQEKARSIRLGQVLLICSPDVLPPTDKVKNTVALSIKRDDQFIIVGDFPYLATCKGTHNVFRSQCPNVVNSSINGYCHYHVSQAKRKVLQQRPHMTTTTKVDVQPKSANGVYFMNGSLQNTKVVPKTKEMSEQQKLAEEKMLQSFMKQETSLGSKYVKVVQDGVQEQLALAEAPAKPITDLRQLLGTNPVPVIAKREQSKLPEMTLQVAESTAMKSIVENAHAEDKLKRKKAEEMYAQYKAERLAKKLKESEESKVPNVYDQKSFYCITCTKLTAIYPKECYQQEHQVENRTVEKSLWQCKECPEVTQDNIGKDKPTLVCKKCQCVDWVPSHIKIRGPLNPV